METVYIKGVFTRPTATGLQAVLIDLGSPVKINYSSARKSQGFERCAVVLYLGKNI